MDGKPMVGATGVAALATATDPTLASAQVIPAMAVKRLSGDNMSISLCREAGATVDDFEADATSPACPAALEAERIGQLSMLNDGAAPRPRRLTLRTVLADPAVRGAY
jgi:hypothetical protein